ncbi:MAG: hypothetical protein IJG86_08680 [Clostridia bacterium]|nr:hypothetical protein [Clostridia bacterium]
MIERLGGCCHGYRRYIASGWADRDEVKSRINTVTELDPTLRKYEMKRSFYVYHQRPL